ncbi:MAG: hypothetical protein ABJN95_18375 [Maribacter sp.]|uniref:hypothetical protein n=1 Tax=Maribacter sp. TaxID=1897614 RepID=UPI003296BB5E
MKLVISLIISILSFASASFNDGDVYICKGKGSKKYHYTKSCRGLSRCSTKVYEVSLKKAKEMGRTLCGWED